MHRLYPTEPNGSYDVLARSLSSVSPERRASALQAVDPGVTVVPTDGTAPLPRPRDRQILNRAALSPDLECKVDAISSAGLYELIGNTRIGKAGDSADPVPLDHLAFRWTLDGVSVDHALARHQRYGPIAMLWLNTALYSATIFVALLTVVYLVRGSLTPVNAMLLVFGAVSILPGTVAGWLVPLVYSAPAPPFRFTKQDRRNIDRAVITVSGSSPEGRLAFWAKHLADSIVSSPAWSAEFLADQPAGFDAEAIADEAQAHAVNIADLRGQIDVAPAGDLAEQVAARASLDYESKLINAMVETLRYRVAGLWLYNESIAGLDQRITARSILEASIARVHRLEGAAQQMGLDILAASELAEKSAVAVRAQPELLMQGSVAILEGGNYPRAGGRGVLRARLTTNSGS